TTVASSTNSTQLPLSSTWRSASVNLSAYAGQTVLLRFNFDTIDSVANTYEGWYVDDVAIQVPGGVNDFYAFSLSAGDSATLALNNLTAGSAQLRLLDSAGNTL